jgi:acyl transferase domain-containing protein
LGPEAFIIESNVKMLSPDGQSRMWDKNANGYARGDGVAALVVKPLSAALEDNDHIECIIRETGINQDGNTAGLTMPSPASQRELIRKTYAKAGLECWSEKDRPQFFEAHGTGTPAGGMFAVISIDPWP